MSRVYTVSLAAVGTFLCLPVLSVDHAPLVDYPNHLARAYILATYSQTPAFVAEYRTVLEPIPNVAIDLMLPALLGLTAIVLASKIFLAMLVVLFVLACHCLGKAIHGRPTWMAIPCCFFVYNSTLLYGYVNYILGVGLYALALAYWLSHRHRWTGVSLVLAAALVFAAYLAHLSAYAFICATISIVEGFDYLTQGRRARTVVVSLIPLALPVVAFAAFMRGSGEVGRADWNSVSGKLVPLLTVFVSYSPLLDGLAILSTATFVAIAVAYRQRFAVNPPILISGLALFLLYCLSPKGLFTSSGVDARFILPAILLCALSVRIEVPSRAVATALCVCVLMFGLRVGGIWHTWLQLDTRITAEVARLMALPVAARVYPVFATASDWATAKQGRSFQHVVQYATIYRLAFVPTLFALRGQQPLLFRKQPKYATPSNQDRTAWLRYMRGYDYVWTYGISPELKQMVSTRARMIREVDGFGLWQLAYTD